MTAQFPTVAGSLSPADLIAGPCALPEAPLAMPCQMLEPGTGMLRRMLSALLPRPHAPKGAEG